MYGGTEFPIVVGRELTQEGGTSLSSPLLGGIIALLNEQSMAAVGQPLGFVSSLFYQMALDCQACFNDVAFGNNCCPTSTQAELNQCGGCTGFPSVAGWDAVTGFGSPRVSAMQAQLAKYLAALPVVAKMSSSSSSSSSTGPSNTVPSSPGSSSVSSDSSSHLSAGAIIALAIAVPVGVVLMACCVLVALARWWHSRPSPPQPRFLQQQQQQQQHEPWQ